MLFELEKARRVSTINIDIAEVVKLFPQSVPHIRLQLGRILLLMEIKLARGLF